MSQPTLALQDVRGLRKQPDFMKGETVEHFGSNSQWIWKRRDCSRSPALTFKSQAVRVLRPQTIPTVMAVLTCLVMGCTTTKPSDWQQSLWQTENRTNRTPEIGRLESGEIEFDVIVTEFQETTFVPYYPYEPKVGLTFMAVSVTCRNLSGEMLQLLTNPIQMIDPFQSLVNEIPIPQELIQFYGGRFAASANVHGVVEDFRAPHRAAYHSQLYRQRFSSVPLPVGVSTSWTQYYPYSPHKAGPIKVILLGHGHIRDTVPFVRVPEPPRLIPPPSNPPTPEISAEVLVIGIALGIVGAIYLLNQVN